MLRKYIIRLALSAALVLGGAAGARADDLVIDGLGKIPLGNAVTVQNGNGTDIQNFLKKGAERKGYGKTSNAAMWTLMTVPPGMNVYPEKPPYPYESMELYQLRKRDVRGVYTAIVVVLSGTPEVFFHEGNRRAEKFWSDAFREDAKRPSTLFGMPKIQLKEFQNVVDEVLKDKKGGANKVKVLTVSPWRAYKQEDGEYRWGQDAKIIMTMPNGLSFPLWVGKLCFQAGKQVLPRYYQRKPCSG